MHPITRRRVIGTIGSVAGITFAGCSGISRPNESPTMSPTSVDSTSTSTPSPCDVIDDTPSTTTTDHCPDVEITYISDIARTPTETAEATETTIPGAAGDNVVIKVRVNGETTRTLVGCIKSTNGREQHISKRLAPQDQEYRLEFGPYEHHGVERVVAWIRGCNQRVYWP